MEPDTHCGCGRSELECEAQYTIPMRADLRARVAWDARLAYTGDCPGSDGRLAQLVRAPALQAGCRGFESLTAHHSFECPVDPKNNQHYKHLTGHRLCSNRSI